MFCGFLATRKCQEPVEPSAITSHCEAVIRAAAILLAILSSEWCPREKAVRTAAVDGKNVARTVQRTFPTPHCASGGSRAAANITLASGHKCRELGGRTAPGLRRVAQASRRAPEGRWLAAFACPPARSGARCFRLPSDHGSRSRTTRRPKGRLATHPRGGRSATRMPSHAFARTDRRPPAIATRERAPRARPAG